MSDRTWSKIGAGSGLGFVLLLVLGYILGANNPPAFGGDVSGFVASNGNEIDAASALFLGALAFFAFFIGAIAANNRKSDREGRLSAAGHAGGITVLTLGIATVIGAAAAKAASDAGDGGAVVEALWNTGALLFLGVLLGAAVLILATGHLALKNGSHPAWHGILSIVAAVYLGAVAIIGVTVQSGAFSPYDGELVQIGLLVFAIWSLVTSVSLLQRVK